MFESSRFNVFDVESFLDNSETRFKTNSKAEKKKLTDIIKKCPECNSRNIYHASAETICRECGIVLEDGLPENKPGYRVFGDPTKDLKRIQSEKQKIGRSMTTEIGYSSYASGNFSPEITAKMARLRKWDSRLKTTKEERVTNEAINYIRVACSDLQLPNSVKEGCILFFQKFVKNELDGNLRSNGVRIKDLASAVIFKICRDRGVPYTINEIADTLRIDPGNIRSCFLSILQTLDKEERKIQTPVDYIPRTASLVEVTDGIAMEAMKIMTESMEKEDYKRKSMGKNAVGFAVAAVYLACLLNGVQPQRTREVVSSYTDVADTTIKKRAEDIISLLDIEDDVRNAYDTYYKNKDEKTINRLKNY